MNRKGWAWQGFVIAVGIAMSVAGGMVTAPTVGNPNGFVWFLLLLWLFVLGYAANRIQLWLIRPPLVHARTTFLGAVAFLPFFLGWFPASSWMQGLGASAPAVWWTFGPMFWGLLAPGGVIVAAFQRLRG